MALLRRTAGYGDRTDVETERTGTSPGLVRALTTLLAVAVAGFLVWLAQEIADGGLADTGEGDFWNAVALLAAAGFVLAFSFDTTGPRTQRVVREPSVPDEDVHDYRRERERETTTVAPTSTGSR